ncbi:hypothetical protein SLA2020_433940 [Shorea laevis]
MQANEDGKWKTYSVKELSKLVYIHGAVSEALRLYPPVPFEHRASVQPDILPSDHPVGRNTKIILSLYSLGRSKEIGVKIAWSSNPKVGFQSKAALCTYHLTSSCLFLQDPGSVWAKIQLSTK